MGPGLSSDRPDFCYIAAAPCQAARKRVPSQKDTRVDSMNARPQVWRQYLLYIFAQCRRYVARLATGLWVSPMFFPVHLWPAELDASGSQDLRKLCETRLRLVAAIAAMST